jgi:hypothetical protein
MRFMMLVEAGEESEAGMPPTPELAEAEIEIRQVFEPADFE